MTTRHFVLDAGRHAIQVLAFCCVVAVLTQTIWPQEAYSTHLVKSLSIGLVIWLVIEFGRLLVPQRRQRVVVVTAKRGLTVAHEVDGAHLSA